MTGKEIQKSAAGSEEQLLVAKALDSAFLCLKKNSPVFTDFYDPKSAAHVSRAAQTANGVLMDKFGGHVFCERTLTCFYPSGFPENEIRYPIKSLFIDSSKFVKNLTHRDFLGALIGLGLDRGKIGDIFVNEGNAVVFVRDEIADFIITSLTGTGRAKVRVSEFCGTDFPLERDGRKINVTVPSMRLDAVLGEAFNLSRSKASDLIRAEKASVNWELARSVSRAAGEGDVISVRGLGRAVIREIRGESKKGRIILEIERY